MSATATQRAFDLPFRPAQGREDFWVSPSNEMAVAWIDKWPDWPTPFLILHGPASSGKSHLATVWQARSNGAVIEDIEARIGDRDAEEALFHRYNRMKEEGNTALVTAATPPGQWPFVIPDLRSRLMAQSSVAIDLPDDDLLRALIVKLVSDRRLDVGPEVINYMLMRVERSFEAVKTMVETADNLALERKKPITIPLLRGVFEDGSDQAARRHD